MSLVGVEEIARALGCSERQVQLLVRQGMPRDAHGKYDPLKVLAWREGYHQQKQQEAEQSGNGLEREQERLTAAKADLAEIELAKARGSVIPLELYKRQLTAQVMSARQHIMGLPSKLAPQLEGESRAVIRHKLKKGIEETLQQLACSPPPDPDEDLDVDGKSATNTEPGGLAAAHDGDGGVPGAATTREQRGTRAVGSHTGRKHRRMVRKKSHTP